jgi:hypothetical protein
MTITDLVYHGGNLGHQALRVIRLDINFQDVSICPLLLIDEGVGDHRFCSWWRRRKGDTPVGGDEEKCNKGKNRGRDYLFHILTSYLGRQSFLQPSALFL